MAKSRKNKKGFGQQWRNETLPETCMSYIGYQNRNRLVLYHLKINTY